MRFSRLSPFIGAVASIKGGVGKTTTTANLAGSMRSFGMNVLVLSMDPQKASIDDHLHDTELSGDSGGYRVLRHNEPIVDHIITTSSGIDMLPGGDDLNQAAEFLAQKGRSTTLKQRIAELPRRYDAILIDCGPNLNLLTINALHAANRMIVPVQYERPALLGLQELQTLVNEVRVGNTALKYGAVLPCNFDPRTKLARAFEPRVREAAGRDLYESMIRRDILAREAWNNHVPLIQYAPTSNACEEYLALARHLVGRKAA